MRMGRYVVFVFVLVFFLEAGVIQIFKILVKINELYIKQMNYTEP